MEQGSKPFQRAYGNKNFIGKKYLLKFFVADPDPGSDAFILLDPGWKKSDLG